MNGRSVSSTVRYILGVLFAEALLLLISFATAGFAIRGMGLALAFWGVIALLYGVWRLAGSQPEDARVTAVKAMRGQAGANPLANYASRQEYKLTRLQERIAEVESAQRTDGREPAAPQKEMERLLPICFTGAGLLALILSWLAGQLLPR